MAARVDLVLTLAKRHGVEDIIFAYLLAVQLGTEVTADISHGQRNGSVIDDKMAARQVLELVVDQHPGHFGTRRLFEAQWRAVCPE